MERDKSEASKPHLHLELILLISKEYCLINSLDEAIH